MVDTFFKNTPHDKRLMNINSNQRDPVKYPEPNNFRITLFSEIKDILYIKLLDAQIPVSDFNVNEFNNGFVLTDNGVDYPITLPIGDYDSNKLITELTTLLNGLAASNVYTVSIVNGMLRIQGTGGTLPFFLRYEPPYQFADSIVSASGGISQEIVLNQSARTVMGFDIDSYESVGGPIGEILSPNKINLVTDKLVYLYLSTSDKDSFPLVETLSQGGRDTFYVIPLSSPRNTYTYYENQYSISYIPNPVIRRARGFTIQLRTDDARRLYNTRGLDYCISLEIGSAV